MSRRRVLVINLGWEQLPLVAALARPERDLDLYGVHHDASTVPAIGFRDVLIADMRDLARIVEFADRIRPDAVISDECDYALFAQAFLAHRYGRPGPNMPAAHRSSNKLLQREAAAAAGIPVPDFTMCLAADDVRRFGERTGWPIIVKPNDNRGSFGVSVVHGPEFAADAYVRALIRSHSRLVLAERFVFGQHLTIDGYCAPGATPLTLALAGNHKFGGAEGTVNESIIYPAELTPATYCDAWELAQSTASTLGYDFGPFHGEYIVEQNTGKLYLTEMSNRGGGVHISNIAVPYACGVDMVNRHIDDALGVHSQTRLASGAGPRAVMLRFFAEDRFAGRRLRAARGMDAITRIPGVLCCRLFIAPGSVFGKRENGGGRHGMVIVGADHRDKLESLASESVRRLEIELEPEQS